MHHTRKRRAASGLHVGDGAHRGASTGQAPQQRSTHVSEALANQLAIGVVLGAGDVVGHQRGEQRVDRAEHRQGERITAQHAQITQRQLRPTQLREALGNLAQTRQGLDRQQQAQGRDTHQCHQGRGQHGVEALGVKPHHREGERTNQQGKGIELRQFLPEAAQDPGH